MRACPYLCAIALKNPVVAGVLWRCILSEQAGEACDAGGHAGGSRVEKRAGAGVGRDRDHRPLPARKALITSPNSISLPNAQLVEVKAEVARLHTDEV